MTFSVAREQVVTKSSIAARICRYRGELTGSMRFSNGPHKQETYRLTSHDSQETSPNCYPIQARVLISCIQQASCDVILVDIPTKGQCDCLLLE